MNNLILLRHAKSVSVFNEIPDFKRTLNEKGREDVPYIANAFKEIGILPDIILCSTAFRTRETLEIFNKTINLKADIVYIDELYNASASDILDKVIKYKQNSNIMVVGHNFGISELANHLSRTGAKKMSTCGLYIMQFGNGVEDGKGEILHYLSPKNN